MATRRKTAAEEPPATPARRARVTRRRSTGTRPTVQDLARELGVSTATISRALNGYQHVNEETRARIIATAERVGYQPNVLARALRQEHTRLVGLIVPNVRSEFFAAATAVLQAVLEEQGYRLILGVSADNPDTDREYVHTMVQHRVEGILHVPCTPDGAVAYLAGMADPPPVVEFMRHSRNEASDSVIGDDDEGSAVLARRLIDLGHRRLAVIAGPQRFSTAQDRTRGFVIAAGEAGLDVDVRHGDYAHATGYEVMHELLSARVPPTGVFAAGNQLVSGALQAVNELGLELPRDLSLVGADNPDWYASVRPGVTTYVMPLEQMGLIAAQTLIGRMSGDEARQPVGRVRARLAGRLVLRGSCGPVPAPRRAAERRAAV